MWAIQLERSLHKSCHTILPKKNERERERENSTGKRELSFSFFIVSSLSSLCSVCVWSRKIFLSLSLSLSLLAKKFDFGELIPITITPACNNRWSLFTSLDQKERKHQNVMEQLKRELHYEKTQKKSKKEREREREREFRNLVFLTKQKGKEKEP